MDPEELIQRKEEIQRRIGVLEWDRGRKQIHLGHAKRLDELREELSEIESSLNPEKSEVFNNESKEI